MKRSAGLFALAVLLFASPSPAAPARVSGRILAPEGQGAPAARVELFRVRPGYEEGVRKLSGKPEPPPAAAVQARPDGSYEVTAPEEGLFRIAIRAEGYIPMEARAPVLEETEMPPARLVRASALQVRVTGPDRKPAEGVSLCLSQAEFDLDEIGTPWERVRCGASGAGGTLSLPAGKGGYRAFVVTDPRFFGQSLQLPEEGPVEIRLTARKPLTIEARGRDGRPRSGVLVSGSSIPLGLTGEDGRLAVAVPDEATELDLEDSEGQRGRLTLQAGEVIGRAPRIVTLGPPDVATGRILDSATRAPLAKALVWTADAQAWTAADGSFRLPVPPDPEVRFEAAAAGHTRGTESLGRENRSSTLLLAPASSIAGRVVDTEGRPVAGAELRAKPAQPSSPEEMMMLLTGVDASTRSDGSFRIGGLLPGQTYKVTASHEDFASAEVPADSSTPGRSAREIRIVLSRGVAASGRVVDAEGAPVAGAELTLLPAWEGGSITEHPSLLFDSAKIETASGPTGAFRFPHLSPGRVHLRVRREGFSTASVRGIEIPDRPGEVDLGEVRLEPGAVIEGVVTDERGAPVEGAMVMSFQIGLGMNMDEQHATMTELLEAPIQTGPDGRFRIEDQVRGRRFDLTVIHPSYPKAEVAGVEAPTPEPLRIRLRAPRSLAGRVVDPEGRPVPHAEISKVELAASSLGVEVGWNADDANAETDEGGRFRLTGLSPGDLSLTVQAPGYRIKKVDRVRIPEDRDAPPIEISLEVGAVLEGRVLDARGNSVAGASVSASRNEERSDFPFLSSDPQTETDGEGRYRLDGLETATYHVWAESREGDQKVNASIEVRPGANRLDLTFPSGIEVSGRVVDELGAPVPGALVTLLDAAASDAWTTRSSADGSFRFPAIPDDGYRLSGKAGGFAATPYPQEVRVAGAPVRGLELRLSRGATITGRLLGISPAELAEVSVTAFFQEPAELDEPLLNGVVDSQGRYRVPQATPGVWEVTAVLSSGRDASGEVEVAPGEEVILDLQFRTGVTLHGRVLLDGEPVGGAELLLLNGEDTPSTPGQGRTAYDGTFAIPGLQPGEQTLSVDLPGGFSHSQPVQVAADQPVLVEIATGVVAGRVLSAEGLPVAGAQVFLKHAFEEPPSRPRAESDEQGTFEIPGVPAGSYEIVVQSQGYKASPSQVAVPPGGRTQVQAVLAPAEPTDGGGSE